MHRAAVEARRLGMRYREDAWVFRDLSFSLPKGATLAVLGPNGRGKSSLLRLALGLQRPSEGEVTTSVRAGYVPQAAVFPFAYRAHDVVAMGRAPLLGFFAQPSKRDYDFCRALMAELAIESLAERSVTTLSGGEKQMVLIARALAGETSMLMLDEPTAALDYAHQQTVLRLLHRLRLERGMTLLFTTHAPQHAQLCATHVLLMHGPGAHVFGGVDEVLCEDRLSALYDVPVEILNGPDGARHIAPRFMLESSP
jgi:iron complex transport system ATP-binding protein